MNPPPTSPIAANELKRKKKYRGMTPRDRSLNAEHGYKTERAVEMRISVICPKKKCSLIGFSSLIAGL